LFGEKPEQQQQPVSTKKQEDQEVPKKKV